MNEMSAARFDGSAECARQLGLRKDRGNWRLGAESVDIGDWIVIDIQNKHSCVRPGVFARLYERL